MRRGRGGAGSPVAATVQAAPPRATPFPGVVRRGKGGYERVLHAGARLFCGGSPPPIPWNPLPRSRQSPAAVASDHEQRRWLWHRRVRHCRPSAVPQDCEPVSSCAPGGEAQGTGSAVRNAAAVIGRKALQGSGGAAPGGPGLGRGDAPPRSEAKGGGGGGGFRPGRAVVGAVPPLLVRSAAAPLLFFRGWFFVVGGGCPPGPPYQLIIP